MKNIKKIKEFLLEYFDLKDLNELVGDATSQMSAIQHMESDGLISFSFEERSTECDYYITAETGLTIELDCKRYVGVVFDYDVKLYETTAKELIETIKDYEKTAVEIINKLKKLN